MWFTTPTMVSAHDALPGRDQPLLPPGKVHHEVLGTLIDQIPNGMEVAYLALGCFWGAEKLFWELDGVHTTAVGYQGGFTPNPTYEEVCSGRTGHAETVQVAFDPQRISYSDLVRVFLENHDPTQGMRQGNDRGTQYRSAIFTVDEQQARLAAAMIASYQPRLTAAGFPDITTEVVPADPFYFAEGYHQQYLAKNPNGYCPIHATGVVCGPGN